MTTAIQDAPASLMMVVPVEATRIHVPPGARKPRPAQVGVEAPVRVRVASRRDLDAAACVVSGSLRSRDVILVDRTGAHYAPLRHRIGQRLSVPEFQAALRDPETAYRLQQHPVGAATGRPHASALPSREVVDDGIAAASRAAQERADGWLVVGDVVHALVRPPSLMVRFEVASPKGHYHVAPSVGPVPPTYSICLNLGPDEDPSPYARVLEALGRIPATGPKHTIQASDAPPRFGKASLARDMRACLPYVLVACHARLPRSSDIRLCAALARAIAEEGDPGPWAERAGALLADVAAVFADPVSRGASALYGERRRRLA
jgi:hypothetical protein